MGVVGGRGVGDSGEEYLCFGCCLCLGSCVWWCWVVAFGYFCAVKRSYHFCFSLVVTRDDLYLWEEREKGEFVGREEGD